MKKITFLLLFAFTTIFINAQIQVGIKAGVNMSDMPNGDVGYFFGTNNKLEDINPWIGYHIGIDARYMFTENIGINSGLYFTMLGYDQNVMMDITDHYLVETYFYANPTYLQLPVNFLYSFKLSKSTRLSPYAGIYLGYGIGGNVSFDLLNQHGDDPGDIKIGGKIDYFGDKLNLNRFDMGLNAGVDLDIRKFMVGINGKYGLSNVFDSYNVGNVNNVSVNLSIGYFFLR